MFFLFSGNAHVAEYNAPSIESPIAGSANKMLARIHMPGAGGFQQIKQTFASYDSESAASHPS